jgi:hypothetical protein
MTHLTPDDFADVVVQAIKAALAPIVARLKAAEDMIADLRADCGRTPRRRASSGRALGSVRRRFIGGN